MTKEISAKEMLSYLTNELALDRRNELDQYFLENPYFFNVLKGLATLKKELKDDEAIEEYLKQIQEEIQKYKRN